MPNEFRMAEAVIFLVLFICWEELNSSSVVEPRASPAYFSSRWQGVADSPPVCFLLPLAQCWCDTVVSLWPYCALWHTFHKPRNARLHILLTGVPLCARCLEIKQEVLQSWDCERHAVQHSKEPLFSVPSHLRQCQVVNTVALPLGVGHLFCIQRGPILVHSIFSWKDFRDCSKPLPVRIE